MQVWDGKIVLDEHGIAGRLKTKILDYIEQHPKKTAGEIAQEVEWCEKMLLRTMREDVEGYFRRYCFGGKRIECNLRRFA